MTPKERLRNRIAPPNPAPMPLPLLGMTEVERLHNLRQMAYWIERLARHMGAQ